MNDDKNLTLDELIDIHKATVNTIEGVFKKEHLEFDDCCLDQITFRDYWVARHTIEHLEKLRELKSTMGSDTYYIIPKNGTWIVNGVNILDKIKEAMDEAQGVRIMKKVKSKKVRFSHDSYAYCPHCRREIVDALMKPGRCVKCNGEIDWD